MILADKIMELRKRFGWSQEQLAEQLGVSRQSVSKWESALSIPDMEKIIKIGELFGVSVDYLVKEEMEKLPEGVRNANVEIEKRTVSLEEAETYIELLERNSSKVALGTFLCIISPVCLMALIGMAEAGLFKSENLAVGIGIAVVLILVGTAVAIFSSYDFKLKRYQYVKEEPIVLQYGVKGAIEKRKLSFESKHHISEVIGRFLCIISAVPLIVISLVSEDGSLIMYGVCLLLIMVASGVFLMVRVGAVWEGYESILGEGEFTDDEKISRKESIPWKTAYWPVVLAIYLGWSFFTNQWNNTWPVWPVAGVLYGPYVILVNGLQRRRKSK